eukprot:scaffold103590_cov54-Attheya_sp.AAC.2
MMNWNKFIFSSFHAGMSMHVLCCAAFCCRLADASLLDGRVLLSLHSLVEPTKYSLLWTADGRETPAIGNRRAERRSHFALRRLRATSRKIASAASEGFESRSPEQLFMEALSAIQEFDAAHQAIKTIPSASSSASSNCIPYLQFLWACTQKDVSPLEMYPASSNQIVT